MEIGLYDHKTEVTLVIDNLTGFFDTITERMSIEYKTTGGKLENDALVNEVDAKHRFVVLALNTVSDSYTYPRGRKYYATIEGAVTCADKIREDQPNAKLVIAKVVMKIEPMSNCKVTKFRG